MKWLNEIVPYKIETDRLVIKCWEPCYAAQLRNEIEKSSSSLLPWMPFAKPPFPTVNEEINTIRMFRGNYDLNKDFVLGVFDKEEKIVIGSTGLHTRQGINVLEIGYWIGIDYQNEGYATEVASALIKTAFELSDIVRVEINTAIENIKSQNVIRKLNMKFDGIIRKEVIDADGMLHDIQKWSLIREEYHQSAIKDIRIRYFDSNKAEIK